MTREEFLRWASPFPEALLLATSDGEILAGNQPLAELFGKPEKSIVGMNLCACAPGGEEYVRLALRLWCGSGRMIYGPAPFMMEGTGPLRCEGAVIRPADSAGGALVVVRVKPKQAATERFLGLNRKLDELNREIRARKASEASIDKQREWLQVTLASIGEAVVATDAAGRVEFMNTVAERFTGWRREEAAGKPVTEICRLFDPVTSASVPSPLGGILAQQGMTPPDGEVLLRSRSGAQRPVEATAARIKRADGALIGAVVIFHDVSRQQQARAAVERARDEALAAVRAKDDFLAAVSHELRTPLNPVLLLASQAATDPALSEEIREDFSLIQKHILLEARLIDDLLDVTRIARGKMSLNLGPVDLDAILADSIETVQSEIEEKQLTLTTDFQAVHPQVVGDHTRLQQVFWNVLKNSVKFTPAHGKLSVTTRAESPRRVAIEFTDTGVGMTPEELSRLFVPFSQGEPEGKPAAHRFGGLGLGLAISKAIVDLHHGHIEARSQGRTLGATVVVVLPLAPEPTPA